MRLPVREVVVTIGSLLFVAMPALAGHTVSRAPKIVDANGTFVASLADASESCTDLNSCNTLRREGDRLILIKVRASTTSVTNPWIFPTGGANFFVYPTSDCSGARHLYGAPYAPSALFGPTVVSGGAVDGPLFYAGNPIELRTIQSVAHTRNPTDCTSICSGTPIADGLCCTTGANPCYSTPFDQWIGPAKTFDISGFTGPFSVQ